MARVKVEDHAKRLIEAHSIKGAIKLAKGMTHILRPSVKVDPRRFDARKNLRWWMHMTAYLESRLGKKVAFSEQVLNQYHTRAQPGAGTKGSQDNGN